MGRRQRVEVTVPAPVITRRTLLDWLGASAVLSLAACARHQDVPMGSSPASSGGADGAGDPGYALGGTSSGNGLPGGAANRGGGLGAGGDGGLGGAGSGPTVAFEPGPEPTALVGSWPERTVDPQDLAAVLAEWTLTVDGLVQSPRVLSFAQLLALPRQDQVTDFHCVEGWSVYDVPWNGVHLSQLLALVSPLPAATHLTFHCFGDGYDESLPLDVALEPRTMLGYGVGGNTLPVAHGFPLRVVVPRLFGYKNAKYVQRIEVGDAPVDGYWVRRGYGYDAEVQPSRLRDGKY
jgi:hypothetical protein